MSETYNIQDPRWIVQDLGEEGKNVNNWHFTEKDITQKVKEFLHNFFENKKLFQNGKANLKTTKLKTFSGEAYLINRKNKMKGGCDLTLTIEWQAENDNYTLIGDIKIETLLESMKFYDIETEITILANLEEEEHFGLYDLMKSRGNDEIKSLLARFLKNLKESFINFEGKLEKDKEEKKREKNKI
eukprot:gene2515-3221_t